MTDKEKIDSLFAYMHTSRLIIKSIFYSVIVLIICLFFLLEPYIIDWVRWVISIFVTGILVLQRFFSFIYFVRVPYNVNYNFFGTIEEINSDSGNSYTYGFNLFFYNVKIRSHTKPHRDYLDPSKITKLLLETFEKFNNEGYIKKTEKNNSYNKLYEKVK